MKIHKIESCWRCYDHVLRCEMKDRLNLTIKKQWFDMILSGKKKAEYREIKDYWARRLVNVLDETEHGHYEEMLHDMNNPYKRHKNPCELMQYFCAEFQQFEIIKFTNGYGKDRPSVDVEFHGITIGRGLIKWGAESKVNYFVLLLGDVLAARNVEVIKGC